MKASTSEVQSDSEKLKESPLLNLFLNTLQTSSTLTCQTLFASDKEGEESSNTEVER
jgi:hypothetical protein